MTSTIKSSSTVNFSLPIIPSKPESVDGEEDTDGDSALGRVVRKAATCSSSVEYNLYINNIRRLLQDGSDVNRVMSSMNSLCFGRGKKPTVFQYAIERTDVLVVTLLLEYGDKHAMSLSDSGEKRLYRAYKLLTLQTPERNRVRQDMLVYMKDDRGSFFPTDLLNLILEYIPDYSKNLAVSEAAVYQQVTSLDLPPKDSSIAQLMLPYELGENAKRYLAFSADSNDIDLATHFLMEDLVKYRMNLKNHILWKFCGDDIAKKKYLSFKLDQTVFHLEPAPFTGTLQTMICSDLETQVITAFNDHYDSHAIYKLFDGLIYPLSSSVNKFKSNLFIDWIINCNIENYFEDEEMARINPQLIIRFFIEKGFLALRSCLKTSF